MIIWSLFIVNHPFNFNVYNFFFVALSRIKNLNLIIYWTQPKAHFIKCKLVLWFLFVFFVVSGIAYSRIYTIRIILHLFRHNNNYISEFMHFDRGWWRLSICIAILCFFIKLNITWFTICGDFHILEILWNVYLNIFFFLLIVSAWLNCDG